MIAWWKQTPVTLMVLLVAIPMSASAARVLEKDGSSVRWSGVTQLGFELYGSYPDSVLGDAIQDQVYEAMQLWNAQYACHAPKLYFSGQAGGPPQSGDGRNTIAWVYSDWSGSSNAAADSPSIADIRIGTDEAGAWHILEADVYLNAEQFHWTTDLAAAGFVSGQQVQYLKEDLAHELGHALGLDHPCSFTSDAGVPDCAGGAFSAALMFPNPRYVEPTVDADDVLGLCSLYESTTAIGTGDKTVRVSEGGKCIRHDQCKANLACIDGYCARGYGEAGDVCEVGPQCAGGVCVNGGCRETCGADGQCPYAGQVCDATTNSCAVELAILGAYCDVADDCASAQCLIEPGGSRYCTRICSSSDDCPSGWECSLTSDLNVCRQPRASRGGCSVAWPSPRTGWVQFLLALAIGLRCIRRQLAAIDG